MSAPVSRSSGFVDPYFRSQQLLDSSANNQPIHITARVTDINAWTSHEGVVTRSIIPCQGESIVTGTVERSVFESLSGKPFVVSLQVARVVELF